MRAHTSTFDNMAKITAAYFSSSSSGRDVESLSKRSRIEGDGDKRPTVEGAIDGDSLPRVSMPLYLVMLGRTLHTSLLGMVIRWYTYIVRTSLLGMVIGVPGLTRPASTITPATMGSRVLKTQLGRMRSLQGNTAMCSYSLRFWSRNSCFKN